jgi:tyrosinase
MRLPLLFLAALAGNALGASLESDALVSKGLSNLEKNVAQNGYPSPKTCTWKTVARRKEWYYLCISS